MLHTKRFITVFSHKTVMQEQLLKHVECVHSCFRMWVPSKREMPLAWPYVCATDHYTYQPESQNPSQLIK